MSHRVLNAAFTDRRELESLLKEIEAEGLTVAALGDVTGPRIIVRREARKYDHQVVAVTGRDDATLNKILRQRERDGWVACGLGPCGGATVMILRRELSNGAETSI
ncbi:MAG: hypothetical protein Q8O14_09785 [bacterium]|jgi:hypothetical protein|nr:hypothetical protein [bacterium]